MNYAEHLLAELEAFRKSDFSMEDAIDEIEDLVNSGYDFLSEEERLMGCMLVGDMEFALDNDYSIQDVIDQFNKWRMQ